jgi:purine-binding chemotaxis protein CheW
VKNTAADLSRFSQSVTQFVAFRLGNQGYAFRIEQIQEIVILDRITKTPQVPDYVEGVANLRGTIIPIINLRRLFGMEPKPVDSETRTIVVNVGTRTIGCTVDTVSQVVRISADAIHAAPETITGLGVNYIAGFARVDEQLIVILEIDELLEPQKLEQVSKTVLPEFGSVAS